MLIIAVLSVLLVSRGGRVVLGGTAVAAPDAPAPQVGDCVSEVRGSLAIAARAGFPPLPLSVISVSGESVSFSDCTAQHVGEVVAFRRSPSPLSGAQFGGPSDTQWCGDLADRYQFQLVSRFQAASGDHWRPVVNQRFVAVLGTSRGYSWAICAILSLGLESYAGSYVSSLAGQPAPAPFGACRSAGNPDRPVSCTSRHRSEEFGTNFQAAGSLQDAVDECTALVRAMTGLPDVSAGGLFEIQVAGDKSATNDDAYGHCRLNVIAPNELIGTLTSIGTHELPLR